MSGQLHATVALTPGKVPPYALHRGCVGLQSRYGHYGRGKNLLSLPECTVNNKRGKVHPIKCYRRSRGNSSNLSVTSALDGVGGQSHAPAALPPGKRSGAHCIGGRVGPMAVLNGCGKSRSPSTVDKKNQSASIVMPSINS